jgi:hypothetical protein
MRTTAFNRCSNDTGGAMDKQSDRNEGTKRLIRYCKEIFRQPENLNHYSDKDYKIAERKYVRFCLFGRAY